MMSVWHLLWVVPVAASVGALMMAVVIGGDIGGG
jgi:hypothetical protein